MLPADFRPFSESEAGEKNGKERAKGDGEWANWPNGEVRRLPQEPAQTRGLWRDQARKNPNQTGWGFMYGGVVPRYRKPPCLIGEDTVAQIIYDAEVRVDFGCLRAFPTVDSLHCHDQRPGFLTFR